MRNCKIILFITISILYSSGCDVNDSNYNPVSRKADKMTLENLKESGIDFSKKQLVDFQISVDSESNGKKINKEMERKDFICTTTKNFNGSRWTSECSKEMVLELNQIIEVQEMINKLAKQYKGYSDGWGVLVKPNK